jgi:hypothetical protein
LIRLHARPTSILSDYLGKFLAALLRTACGK